MSQSELSRITGIDASYISKIEAGNIKNPGPSVLKRLADGLHCAVEDLAPSAYYEGQGGNILSRVVRLLMSDTSLLPRDREAAVAAIQEIYRRRRVG